MLTDNPNSFQVPPLSGRPSDDCSGSDPAVHGKTVGLATVSLEEQMDLDSASLHHAGTNSVVGEGFGGVVPIVSLTHSGVDEMCSRNVDASAVAPPPKQLPPSTEERYGSWMQVVGRKCRLLLNRGVGNQGPTIAAPKGGSRFGALANLEQEDLQQQVAPASCTEPREAQVAAEPTGPCPAGNVALQSVAPSEHDMVSREARDEPNLSKNNDVWAVQGVVLSSKKEVRQDGEAYSSGVAGKKGLRIASKVAAKDTVVVVPSSLQSDKHVAVHVVEEGSKRALKENNGRSLYGLIRIASAKGVSRSLAASVNLNRKNSKLKRNDRPK
ncbi:hypothetical protein V6N12_065551 [Hibiscus sabdariffa]|uniref:Uncharacterized protein n=1 Tax=Hibiscus sabdariffa TaxID=183260 RepID=A0ABR2G916_9ROSI